MRYTHKILVRNPEEKNPVGRFRNSWEDMLKEIRCVCVCVCVWIGFNWIQKGFNVEAVVNAVMNLLVT
jgi:hypothetical protein